MHAMMRLAAYSWALPYTLTGIGIGLLLAGRFQKVEGVIEIHGPGIAKVLNRFYVPAMAMTFGHVVFGQTMAALDGYLRRVESLLRGTRRRQRPADEAGE